MQRLIDGVTGGLLLGGFGWLFFAKQVSKWGYAGSADLIAFCAGFFVGALLGLGLSSWMRTRSEQRLISPYGMTMSILAILFWLIPMAMTGALKAKLHSFPVAVRNQYRISCLFTHSSKYWHTIHYQVRLKDEIAWQEGPLDGFFDLDIFGYRSKLNRIVLASRATKTSGKLYSKNRKRLEELSVFIGERWGLLYPEDPPVMEVRFFRVGHKVGEAHCMSREPWSRPPLESIPEVKRELIHRVVLERIR